MAWNNNTPIATNQIAADLVAINANWEYCGANKVTNAGDVLYATAANALSRLGIGTDGQVLITNATADAPAWSSLSGDASVGAGGAVTLASNIKIKGWVDFNGATGALNDSFNVDSVTDEGTGEFTINWTTDFAGTAYAASGLACSETNDVRRSLTIENGGKAAGTLRVTTHDAGDSKVDVTAVLLMAIGDQ